MLEARSLSQTSTSLTYRLLKNLRLLTRGFLHGRATCTQAECISKASRFRSTASTNLNANSSRSHAILTIYLDTVDGSGEPRPYSKICVSYPIQLAGMTDIRCVILQVPRTTEEPVTIESACRR